MVKASKKSSRATNGLATPTWERKTSPIVGGGRKRERC